MQPAAGCYLSPPAAEGESGVTPGSLSFLPVLLGVSDEFCIHGGRPLPTVRSLSLRLLDERGLVKGG